MAMEPVEANNQVEASSRESAPQQEQRAGRENTCAYAHVCEQYDLPAYEDRHETHSYLGWRVIGTMIAWLILGKAVSGDTFFVACFLFAYPILLDCIKFKPVNKLRRLIKWAEVAVSMVWLVFSFLGMAGIFIFAENSNSIIKTADDFIIFSINDMSVQFILRCLLSLVLVTAVDYICRVTAVDTAYDNAGAAIQGAE